MNENDLSTLVKVVFSIAASCYPPCSLYGTCVCGRYSCRCECEGSYTGVDCSIDRSVLPQSSKLALFYGFSDPHFIARPDKSDDPWVMDLSGNGRHGRIASTNNCRPWLIYNYMISVPSTSRRYMNMQWNQSPTIPCGYVDVTDSDYDFSDLTLSSTSKMTVFAVHDKTTNDMLTILSWKPTGPTNKVIC